VFEFKLPDLGEGIQEGEILKWYVNVGDTIEEDASLVDVETDKAAVTIPSPRGGTIIKLNGKVGDVVETGAVLVIIDDGAGVAKSGSSDKATEREEEKAVKKEIPEEKTEIIPAVVEEKKVQTTSEAVPSKTGDGLPVPAAPATRRLARELGVDINKVSASGPGGRVLPEDVRSFDAGEIPEVKTTPGSGELISAEKHVRGEVKIPKSGIPFLDLDDLPDFEKEGLVEYQPVRSIRRKVARKMVTSMVLVPHVAHMDEADLTDLENFRRKERVEREGQPGGRLTLLPFVMKALTVLLKKYPMFNASLDPFREEIIYKKYYNIGFAADTERGLIVPVVKDTDKKSIIQLSADIETLAEKGRNRTITVDEMRSGTITITNVGPIGGTGLIPTINYPEVAILGMGRLKEKPVVRNGEIVIRKILPLTLAFDHRIADGAQAARFVTELIGLLSDTNKLLMEL